MFEDLLPLRGGSRLACQIGGCSQFDMGGGIDGHGRGKDEQYLHADFVQALGHPEACRAQPAADLWWELPT